MSELAKLLIGKNEVELPVFEGTEGEKAVDISTLRSKTGYITLDPALGNTGVCTSNITFIDGEKGVLRYRGIPIEQFVGFLVITAGAVLSSRASALKGPSRRMLMNAVT